MALQRHSQRYLIVFALFLVLLTYALFVIRHTILLIYVAILFALVFTPAVRKLQHLRLWRWSPGRGLAVLILSGITCAVVASFAFLMLPPIIRDTQGFAQDLPSQLQQLSRHMQEVPFGRSVAHPLNPDILTKYADSFFQHGLVVLQSLAGGLFEISILVILTMYFILDGPRSFGWAMSLVAAGSRDRLRGTLLRAQQRVQKWLMGQVLLMLILGSSTALVLGLLHVRYFYALAVFAGVANFIPVVGPVATVVLAGTVAAFDSWLKLLGVIAFYLIYQQVESAYLSPRIMAATVGLPGVAVIVALAVGGALAGVLGALVAVPTAALMATIVDEYFVDHA